MRYLKTATSVDVGVGPFLDETDGKTAETALTITQPDVRLKKNGGNWAQKAAAQTLSHEEAGWYELTLDATDTDTIGILIVAIHESGALPVWMEFHVLAANVYDSLFGAATDKLQVDVIEVVSDAQSATDLKDFADAGYDPGTNYIAGIQDAGGINQLSDLNNPSTTTIAAAVWDALVSGITTANSIGKRIIDYLTGDIFTRLGAPAAASVSADIAAVKVDTAAILVDTGTTLDGRIPAALTADGNMKADALRVQGTAQTAGDLAALIAALTLYATRTVVRGTVGSATAPTTTQFTPSALSPAGAAVDQFKGRILVWDNDTATAELRGQATDITASSGAALPLLTFTQLTTAPSSGDTFSIV